MNSETNKPKALKAEACAIYFASSTTKGSFSAFQLENLLVISLSTSSSVLTFSVFAWGPKAGWSRLGFALKNQVNRYFHLFFSKLTGTSGTLKQTALLPNSHFWYSGFTCLLFISFPPAMSLTLCCTSNSDLFSCCCFFFF